MEPVREIGRMLLTVGAVLVAVGAFLYFGRRLPLRLGRLPGAEVHVTGLTAGSYDFNQRMKERAPWVFAISSIRAASLSRWD